MIGALILISTLILLFISYVDDNKSLKLLSKNNRKFILKNKKYLVVLFSSLIAFLVYVDSRNDESDINYLRNGQNDILNVITLTQKKRDSIVKFYTSKLEVKGEELILAKDKIRQLLDQLDYYNKSTDEVIKKSYGLFLEKRYDEAIKLLEGYPENSTEKRLINIYQLKADLYVAQANFNKALIYLEKLYYLQPDIERKFEYARMLFYNGKHSKSLSFFKELQLEISKNNGLLNPIESFEVYFYSGRMLHTATHYKEAMPNYLESYGYLEKSDDMNRSYYLQQVMNAMAGCLYEDKQYELSEKLFMKVVNNFENSVCHNSDCVLLKSAAYMNLSNVIRVGKKDYKLSLKYLNKGKEIYENEMPNLMSNNQLLTLCSFKYNEGMIYKGMKKFYKAEKLFQECLNLIPFKKGNLNLEFSRLEIKTAIQFSIIYKQTGNREKFNQFYNKYLQLSEDYKVR